MVVLGRRSLIRKTRAARIARVSVRSILEVKAGCLFVVMVRYQVGY